MNAEDDTPPLDRPSASAKVAAGARERLGETFDTAGKAVVAIAGAGIFFFATGYFVEWQKFKRGGLPPDEILPLISKGQIAAAGVRELAVSIFFGALVLAVLGWGGVRIARWANREPEGGSRFRRLLAGWFEREGVPLSVAFGLLTLLFVPLDGGGVIVTVALSLLLYYSLRLIAAYLRQVETDDGATFPLWRLLIAAALAAVVLSGARQREFPEVRPHAVVILKDHREVKGSYIDSDSTSVLLRLRIGGQPKLMILRRDEVERILLERDSYVFPTEKSLVGVVFGADFACIPPECRYDDSRVGISSLL